MKEIELYRTDRAIDKAQIAEVLQTWLASFPGKWRRVLLLPPDITRIHSQAGIIVNQLYQMLSPLCRVDIMPALGTHHPMSEPERRLMFGPDLPTNRFLVHNWRNDVVKIGTIPAEYIAEISDGLVTYPIDVEINRRLVQNQYDLIISIGQVVPHEVAGMAGYTKNVLIGCGGKAIIDQTHFLGAAYGMERIIGREDSPVRRVFDYAEKQFLTNIPMQYILTVTTSNQNSTQKLEGLFIGKSRRLFEAAVILSQKNNIEVVNQPLTKVVVYLEPGEYQSTWLGNKAIYRTRMAIADGGDLIILAPGLGSFGEDMGIDGLIRKYGYIGRQKVLELVGRNQDLGNNLTAAAHLIHGSSDGRFNVTYAPGGLTGLEIAGVHYRFMPLTEAIRRYNPSVLQAGTNILGDGETVFYINNPTLGLWMLGGKKVNNLLT